MAVFNIPVTYPDAQQTRILNALKAAAATPENPTPTNAQAQAWFAGTVKHSLRDVVLRFEREAAVAAAAAAVTPADVT